MKLFDLLIIYFACGAPFGVYQVTTFTRALTVRVAFGSLLRVCLWPVFSTVILTHWFFNSPESTLDRHIDSIRTQIEGLVFATESMSSIFDFREILYRYTGLSEASNATETTSATNELFDLSNNEDKELATICLARKNRRRLFFHYSQARAEFVDMISELAAADQEVKILALAIELAHFVNDPETANALTASLLETRSQESISARTSQSAIKTHSASAI